MSQELDAPFDKGLVIALVGIDYDYVTDVGSTIGVGSFVGAEELVHACWHSVAVFVIKVPRVGEVGGSSAPHQIAHVVKHLNDYLGCCG